MFMNGGKPGRGRSAPGKGKQQAGGGREISVKTLEKPKEAHHQNQFGGPVRLQRALKCNCRCKPVAEQRAPGGNVSDGEHGERVEECAHTESHADGDQVPAAAETGSRFFRILWRGFKAGHEIRHDLERQENGDQRRGGKRRTKVRRVAVGGAQGSDHHEEEQHGGGHGFLEIGAQPNATIVEHAEKNGQRGAKQKAREKHGLAGHSIKLDAIQPRNNVGCDLADGHGFPRADDEIRQQHGPAGEIAHAGRKDLSCVGGFAGGVREPPHPLAIDVADGKKEQSTQRKPQSGAEWAAASEPVVHQHEPAGADHGAEGQREVVVQPQLARELRHLALPPTHRPHPIQAWEIAHCEAS